MPAVGRKRKRTKTRPGLRQWQRLRGGIDTIVFDGDDTLWSTQRLYDSAKLSFLQIIRKRGVTDRDVVRRLDAIDAARVRTFGFAASRFPGSLVALLNEYRETHDLNVDTKLRARVARIGRSVFLRHAPVHRGVRKLLRRLGKGYRLTLITKGSRAVQVRRLRSSGLRRHFDAVYIVKEKTPAELRKILRKEGLQARRTLFVGDSLRSDIGPALAVGAYAAWIPRQSWHYEHGEMPKSNQLIRLRSLGELEHLI